MSKPNNGDSDVTVFGSGTTAGPTHRLLQPEIDFKALADNPHHELSRHFGANISYAYDASTQQYIASIAGKTGRGSNMEESAKALAAEFTK